MEVPSAVVPPGGISLLFTTALEIFDGVETATAFSETDEVLRVKIEIEKVRLIIWGQSVGLNGSAEQRDDALNVMLGEEYLRTAVSELFVCFIKTFEDSGKLRDRYGLIQRANQGEGDAHQQLLGPNQRLLGLTFKRTYDGYRGDLMKGPRNANVQWALSDEKLFRGLVEELKTTNNNLNHMRPAIRNHTRLLLRTNIIQTSTSKSCKCL